jgi:hypothetical protein
MAIASQDHQPAGLARFEHLEQPRALGREIGPRLELVRLGQHLGGRNHDPQVRRLGQFLFEPAPLFITQHRGGGIIIGQIATERRAILRPCYPLEIRAEIARIQHDELHPLARRADDAAFINAGARAHFGR